MKRLSIAIVSPYDIFRFGGVQEHILATKRELTKRGHKVQVIAPRTNGASSDDPSIITIGAATKVNTPLATTAEVAFSAGPNEISRLFAGHQFDIMHFHEPWVPVLSRQLLSKTTARTVGTFHAKLPDNLINKSIERAWLPYGKAVVNRLDVITAVSSAAADYVSRATKKELTIIPNGITLADYDPSKTGYYKEFHDSVPTIFYIGRLEKRKGVDFLLKAFNELQSWHKDVRLVIAGDGPKRRMLKAYVTRRGLNDKVHFLGFVSTEDKLRLLKTCDVFCSPALYGESFGIVLLEAMAMGAPIVAGNNPGYSSVLKERGRLSLIDPRSTLSFAQQLELMLFDKEVAKLMSDWGQDYVRQFDYSKVTDQYEALYAELMK